MDEYRATLAALAGLATGAPANDSVTTEPGHPAERAAQLPTYLTQPADQESLVNHHGAMFSPTGGADTRTVANYQDWNGGDVRTTTPVMGSVPSTGADAVRPALRDDRAVPPKPERGTLQSPIYEGASRTSSGQPTAPTAEGNHNAPSFPHKVGTARRHSRTSTTPSSSTTSRISMSPTNRQAIAEWRLDVFEANAGPAESDHAQEAPQINHT